MAQCFVIQPFDNDKFDRRYADTFRPAIEAAGLDPYRVDQDLSINNLIEGITKGIERSAAVLADLTNDNPNVWYELGHAIAQSKPFCLICSDERNGRYPFDIGHLRVEPYKTGSLSDFEKLSKDITARLKAVYTQREELITLAQQMPMASTKDGLDPFEQAAITSIFEEHLEGEITPWTLRQNMEKSGFTKTASTLAVLNLIKRGFVEKDVGQNYNSETYTVLRMTEPGIDWSESTLTR